MGQLANCCPDWDFARNGCDQLESLPSSVV